MKKFYISIFSAVFLFSSFISMGQVFNSITSNPLNLTLDDPGYWNGPGPQPDNPCNGCTINIYSNAFMVQEGSSSYAPNNCGAPCNFLNDIHINNSIINVYGNTNFTISTYLELNNTTVILGNNPTSTQSIKLNDQVDLIGGSSIRLANAFTWINSTVTGSPTIAGPHVFFFDVAKYPGIYSIIPTDPNGYNYTATLTPHGLGTSDNQYMPNGSNFYQINCDPGDPTSLNTCAAGFVYGPAITTLDPTFGIIFLGSTTLPVELVQFIGNKNDDGSVKLSWATAQEQNSNYYDIERSSNQSDWTSIGSVKAKGYASSTTNYSFTDKLPADGNGYYRLKMVDIDGKFKYSNTVLVSSSGNNRPLVIYSNPFNDQIRMKVNVSRSQNLVLTVSDMLGKTYINQSYHAQAGDNFINLQPNAGSRGAYILRIHGDSYDQTAKLEKQ